MHAPSIVSDTVAPEEALSRLAHYGFLLASEFPTAHGASHLFAAIRPRPTLAHFDPEVVTYWHTDADGRGRDDLTSRAAGTRRAALRPAPATRTP